MRVDDRTHPIRRSWAARPDHARHGKTLLTFNIETGSLRETLVASGPREEYGEVTVRDSMGKTLVLSDIGIFQSTENRQLWNQQLISIPATGPEVNMFYEWLKNEWIIQSSKRRTSVINAFETRFAEFLNSSP